MNLFLSRTIHFKLIASCSMALVLLGINLTLDTRATQAQTTVLSGVNQGTEPLKPGDRIRITVLGFADLSGEQVVAADGTLQLPLAGAIGVGGFTPTAAADQIAQALQPYVRRPQVSLSILSLSLLRVSVTGEVTQPGPRLLVPATNQDGTASGRAEQAPMTLSRALVLAGGITPRADLRNVIVRRRQSMEPTELKVDLWQVIQSGDLSADVRIYDGDEIVVPTAAAGETNRQLLMSSIAPTSITVQVAGEVRSPGQMTLQPTAGVSGAVAAAGGLTNEARRNSIQVFRVMPNGQLEKRTVAFGESSEPLMNGDLILVDQSTRGGLGNVFDFLGRVVNPFAPLLRLFGN